MTELSRWLGHCASVITLYTSETKETHQCWFKLMSLIRCVRSVRSVGCVTFTVTISSVITFAIPPGTIILFGFISRNLKYDMNFDHFLLIKFYRDRVVWKLKVIRQAWNWRTVRAPGISLCFSVNFSLCSSKQSIDALRFGTEHSPLLDWEKTDNYTIF